MRPVLFFRWEGVTDHFALVHVDDHFSDIGGMVSDPFQVFGDIGNFDGPGDGRAVLNHVQEQFVEDLDGELIHLVVSADHLIG